MKKSILDDLHPHVAKALRLNEYQHESKKSARRMKRRDVAHAVSEAAGRPQGLGGIIKFGQVYQVLVTDSADAWCRLCAKANARVKSINRALPKGQQPFMMPFPVKANDQIHLLRTLIDDAFDARLIPDFI